MLHRHLFTIIIVGSLVVLAVYVYQGSEFQENITIYYTEEKDGQGNCQLPKLDPFDPAIQHFLQKAPPLLCKQLQLELTILDDNGILLINKSLLSNQTLSSIDCFFRCFWRGKDDYTNEYGEWTKIENSVQPKCEFMEVNCKKKTFPYSSVYSNTHAQIIRKEETGKRSEKIIHNTKYDVIILVIDSISHSNWIRNLPKTLQVLTTNYNSFVFNGFTKVGDNSFPNAAAFLTGKRVRTAGYDSELEDDMRNKYYDDWPLIWKNYSNQGYHTFYAEDYVYFNLFNYLAKGFREQSFDHTMRTYWLSVYGSYIHRRSTPLCYGNRKLHNIQIDYLQKFLEVYSKEPKFVLNWMTELGHDFMHFVNIADADFERFLRKNENLLKNSFLFVMADHGHRFDKIRESLIGRLEERLPFFSLHIPQEIRKKNEEVVRNLKENVERLTTFFDVHSTLEFILKQNEKGWKSEELEQSINNQNNDRGINLLGKIPLERTCKQAGIPEEFCVCEMEYELNLTDNRVKNAADALVKHVNQLTTNYTKCSKLQLSTINSAQTKLPNKRTALSGHLHDIKVQLRIVVTVTPSSAVFEALLQYHSTDEYTVVGDVNRINKYGSQGDCIDDVNLKKLCFCENN